MFIIFHFFIFFNFFTFLHSDPFVIHSILNKKVLSLNKTQFTCFVLVALFIEIILNRFLQFKQLGIVVENISYYSPHNKKLLGLNQAHNCGCVGPGSDTTCTGSGRVGLDYLGPI